MPYVCACILMPINPNSFLFSLFLFFSLPFSLCLTEVYISLSLYFSFSFSFFLFFFCLVCFISLIFIRVLDYLNAMNILYVQVRFELIYGCEINYLTVHLHEKARKDANFHMTLKQEI